MKKSKQKKNNIFSMLQKPKFSKKGMEMTLSTVIIAILLLIVLAVVIFIFVKGMGRGGGITDEYFNKLNTNGTPQEVAKPFYDHNFFLPLLPANLIFRRKLKRHYET